MDWLKGKIMPIIIGLLVSAFIGSLGWAFVQIADMPNTYITKQDYKDAEKTTLVRNYSNNTDIKTSINIIDSKLNRLMLFLMGNIKGHVDTKDDNKLTGE